MQILERVQGVAGLSAGPRRMYVSASAVVRPPRQASGRKGCQYNCRRGGRRSIAEGTSWPELPTTQSTEAVRAPSFNGERHV